MTSRETFCWGSPFIDSSRAPCVENTNTPTTSCQDPILVTYHSGTGGRSPTPGGECSSGDARNGRGMHARAAFSSARGSENGSELQDLRLQMWGEQTCGRAGTLTGPGYLVHIFVYLFVPFGRQFPGLIRYDRRFPLPRKGHVVRNGCILLLWPGLRPVWESVLLFSLKPGLGDFEL